MRFGLLGAVTRGVRRYVIFSELNFVVPTLVKKSGPVEKVKKRVSLGFMIYFLGFMSVALSFNIISFVESSVEGPAVLPAFCLELLGSGKVKTRHNLLFTNSYMQWTCLLQRSNTK